MFKKLLKSLFIIAIIFSATYSLTAYAKQYILSGEIKEIEENVGGSVCFPYQGCTGTSTAPTEGYLLIGNSSGGYNFIASSSLASIGAGTVTSVAMTVPTGLAITGSPITNSGTFGLTLDTGYIIPLTASTTEWATAYNWGDHAGLYDILGQATSTLTSHTSTYNHDNFYDSLSDIALATGNIFIGDASNHPTATSSLYVDANGYVGIGSTTPFTNFTVAGNMMATGILYDNNYSAGSNGYILQSVGTGYQWVATSTLGITGAVDYPSYLSQIGDVSTTSLANGYTLSYQDGWKSTSTLFISSTQNVGIGSTSPFTNFTVAGNMMATGILYDNNYSAGSNGNVLLSTGTGYQWTATSTLGLGGISAESDPIWIASSSNYLLSATALTLFDVLGQATSTLTSHTSTYNHANYDTAYNWGDHAGLYDILGQATSTLASHTTAYNHANFLVNGSIDTIAELNAILTGEDVASTTWAGASSLITLGTITTGVWNGTVIGTQYGGTGTSTASIQKNTGFTYATSTAWTGTTTIPLGSICPSCNTETWEKGICYTDTGTLKVKVYDGTNGMNLISATSSPDTEITFSSNNIFQVKDKRLIDVGTPASSPTYISCRFWYHENY